MPRTPFPILDLFRNSMTAVCPPSFQITDVVLISTADWDNPYWTNKQYMAQQFANRGHRVLYVESTGLRAPTATRKDFKRIWHRLKRGLAAPRLVNPHIHVWSPLVIPLQRYKIIRKINRWLLKMGIAFWTWQKGLTPNLMWTYSPLTLDLYDVKSYGMLVYHSVDDIKVQPGMPYAAIAAAELQLVKKADVVFTTSRNLFDLHRPINTQTHYFSNVADFDHFHQSLDNSVAAPPELANINRPVIGFVGAISSYKLDFKLLRAIALQRPKWSLVLIGEVGEGDPLTDVSALTALPNIFFLGGQDYRRLPSFLKVIDVAIQPNLINDYTVSMFPMKFFEYLAAGKPVVSTELPALRDYGNVAFFCKTHDEFIAAIEKALAGQGPDLDVRLAAAREQTYDKRTDRMLQVLAQVAQIKNSDKLV